MAGDVHFPVYKYTLGERHSMEPKPASKEAKAEGCTCPPQDGHGLRIRINCPVHGTEPTSTLRDKTSAERKAEPIHSGVLLYFPDALAAVARVSKAGNDKHNPGEPLHWARHKSTDQMDCATRHTLTPKLVDPETGEPELAAAVWRLLAELQLLEEQRNAAKGIKSYSGIAP